MFLIVGLGNPGDKYAGTRHNIGWEVTAAAARKWFADPPKTRFEGLTREAMVGNHKVLLLEPHTFMNLSGRSVQQAARFYRIEPQQVLVICDDMNLPTGRLRVRPGGSAGGQKGLLDIIRSFGVEEIPRLRIGVDRPPPSVDVVAYVLGRFRQGEREKVDEAVDRAVDCCQAFIENGVADAMNRFNSADGQGRNDAGDRG